MADNEPVEAPSFKLNQEPRTNTLNDVNRQQIDALVVAQLLEIQRELATEIPLNTPHPALREARKQQAPKKGLAIVLSYLQKIGKSAADLRPVSGKRAKKLTAVIEQLRGAKAELQTEVQRLRRFCDAGTQERRTLTQDLKTLDDENRILTKQVAELDVLRNRVAELPEMRKELETLRDQSARLPEAEEEIEELARKGDELELALTESRRIQSIREADLTDLQARYQELLIHAERQDGLLVELKSRLLHAAGYLRELDQADQADATSATETQTVGIGPK